MNYTFYNLNFFKEKYQQQNICNSLISNKNIKEPIKRKSKYNKILSYDNKKYIIRKALLLLNCMIIKFISFSTLLCKFQ